MNTLTLWTPCAEVRAETSDAEVLITFAGELDQSLAEHFASLRALVVEGGRPVAVDLSAVTFFGAWAADALVALRAAAPADGFTVRAMSETVRLTLDACDLTLGRERTRSTCDPARAAASACAAIGHHAG